MGLLERDACLDELDAALKDAGSGEGRVVLVSGEAGIGKTSLVEGFTRERKGTARVLWGVSDALFTPLPLGPLHDMAAQARGNLPTLLHSGASRGAIFSAVLSELQNEPPVIAVFEDVHWADEATLDLLRFLSRRIARVPALLVLTYRDDELGRNHPLRIVLGDVSTSTAARRLPLPRLSEQAVQTLVGERGMDAAALHRQTGGNPFFVTEVLGSTPGSLPPTIRDAVLARAARLSPSAQAVLQASAVIGPRVEPWLLAEVAGAEAHAAEECLAGGMLVAQEETLAFRHELARQAILESTSPLHKMTLHRLTLNALNAWPATRGDLARLAHHAAGSGDRVAVLAYGPAAARQAAVVSAHREAAALYALVLRFGDELPAAERATILEAYAWECNVIDRRSEGIAARRKAIELWREVGNPLKQGENMAQLVPMLRGIGQNDEAELCSRTAVHLLEGLPPGRELALAYRTQAVLRLSNRDAIEAISWGEKAIALAEHFGDEDVLSMTHIAVGSAWLLLEYERGRSYLEQRLAAAYRAGRETHVGNAFAHLGACSAELYAFQRAERYLAEGLAYTAERDLDTLRLYMLAWQSLTYLHLGRWNEAAAVGSQVLPRRSASAINRIPALLALGRLHARRGDSEPHSALDEALELATPTGTLQHIGLVRGARAEAAWFAGDRERALEEARAAYDLALSKKHPWIVGELAFWRWRSGEKVFVPAWTAKPFALQIAGDWRAAADEWERLSCPYEQARALADGDAAAQAAALKIYERLGARAAAEALKRALRAEGAPVPRGPRPATRENPFGLTARQVDILRLLTADLSNSEIAARLHISPKTADHHVSAVLAKLDVHSREAAAALARNHPLLHPK